MCDDLLYLFKAGRKIVIKLWDIARLCEPHLAHGNERAAAAVEDRWMLQRVTEATRAAPTAVDVFD